MKVILTGCTGFIGGEVLAHCLAHPRITSIIALSRRALPSTPQLTNPKLKVVIVEDFTNYPDSILDELRGADGCIWAIGTFVGDPAADIDYPMAFCNAMIQLQPDGRGSPFRYVYLGGAFTSRDQDAKLYYYAEARRVRGRAESQVLAFARESPRRERWETCVVKPGAVLAGGGWVSAILSWVVGSQLTIRVDEVAAVMVDAVVNGSEERVWKNAEMVTKGRELLAKK